MTAICGNCGKTTDVVYTEIGYCCATCIFAKLEQRDVFLKSIEGCDNCGDSVASICYGCFESAADNADTTAYCWECGDEASYVYCSYHTPDQEEPGCDECGIEERKLCRDCALEEWQLTPELPGATVSDDGTITIDGMEVAWG